MVDFVRLFFTCRLSVWCPKMERRGMRCSRTRPCKISRKRCRPHHHTKMIDSSRPSPSTPFFYALCFTECPFARLSCACFSSLWPLT
jgi:hypothetical protein